MAFCNNCGAEVKDKQVVCLKCGASLKATPKKKIGCILAIIILPIIVIAIIILLAAISLPQYFKAVEKSRISEMLSVVNTISQAEQRYNLSEGRYTNNLQELDIEVMNSDGTTATRNELKTKYYQIEIAMPEILATRKPGGNRNYTLTFNIRTDKTECKNNTSTNDCEILELK